ncbi:MAG: alpha/beta hydrolase [Bifidobacteriaceae bacterium]|nr:alpha/beta hydrolase [Bifidobacteriaceae bacterium]
MTKLAVRGFGTLAGAQAPGRGSPRDPWRQDDETSRLSAAERGRAEALSVPADAVPLVLLHAFPLSSLMWEPMAAELPELAILTVDLPGAGFSPLIEPATIQAAGRAVIASLRALGVTRAVVGGISMGGYVAMSIMRDAPELLAGAILMHTKARADDPAARAARLATARQALAADSTEALAPMAAKMVSAASRASSPGLVETIERWIAAATPAGVAWAEEAMAGREDLLAVLTASGLPTTLLAGVEDPFTPVAAAEEMAEAIGPGGNLAVLADVAHLGPLEAPNMTARLVREAYRRMV